MAEQLNGFVIIRPQFGESDLTEIEPRRVVNQRSELVAAFLRPSHHETAGESGIWNESRGRVDRSAARTSFRQ